MARSDGDGAGASAPTGARWNDADGGRGLVERDWSQRARWDDAGARWSDADGAGASTRSGVRWSDGNGGWRTWH